MPISNLNIVIKSVANHADFTVSYDGDLNKWIVKNHDFSFYWSGGHDDVDDFLTNYDIYWKDLGADAVLPY